MRTFSNLARVVVKRTWARKDSGFTESFPQTVERVIAGNVRGHSVSAKEVDRLRYFLGNGKAGPAGRGWWYSGSPGHSRIGGVALSNCFSGDTRFWADGKLVAFRDVVGKVVDVMCHDGTWRSAQVRSFGTQKLCEVTFKVPGRSRHRQTFSATVNHTWITDRGRVTDLKPGDRVVVTPRDVQMEGETYAKGFTHGVIFGDGTRNTYYHQRFSVRLCGKKAGLLGRLVGGSACTTTPSYKGDPLYTVISPSINLKEVPGPEASLSYQRGFVDGWMATDGSSRSRLGSQDHKALDWVIERAPLLGLTVRGDCLQDNETNYGPRAAPLRTLVLVPEPTEMVVESVTHTDREEEVFCVTEPVTSSFTLEGGVVTGNCWFVTSDDWHNFVLAQDLLMLGGGVGMSVEHKYSSKLPRVKKDVKIFHKLTKDADFIVPDSREGWCELTRRVLESFFVSGKSWSYSTVCLRGAGEPIRGFGGTASGPGPVVTFIEKLCALLIDREGRDVRPIDAADILCSIAEMVVSGNVRRSALLIAGDPWDKEFLKAKRWDLSVLPTQRSCANFSVVAEDVDDLHPLFWQTYEHGEAFGIVNLANIRKFGRMGERKKDTAQGVNPCQPAWATVLTRYGIRTLGQVREGDEIWSGQRWTKVVKKWSTGMKPVYGFRTRAGTFFGTQEHRVVSYGEKVQVKDAEAIDLARGEVADKKVDMRAIDIMAGLMHGDGFLHKATNRPMLCIGRDDQSYFASEICDLIGPNSSDSKYYVETGYCPLQPTNLREVPEQYLRGEPWKVRGFLRGLFSANGSVPGNRVSLKSSSRLTVDAVQQMLSSVGISSYVTTNTAHEVQFENGTYTCKESYDLNVGTGLGRKRFCDLIGFIQPYKNLALQNILGSSIGKAKDTFEVVAVETFGEEEVFDLTVDAPEHTYWSGGLLVSNCGEATLEDREPCNIQDIALSNIESEDEFEEAGRLMHRWGKRVTMERYHHESVQRVIERNRRVGTGITGCLEAPHLFNPRVLDRVYAAIQDENVKYSRELGINQSIRTTVIKPSGTWSKAFDVRGEGIHAGFSRYMIQRIRFAANDPLIPRLREAGHRMEPALRFDGSTDPNTLVVDFYLETPASLPCADEGFDTWQQLDAVLMAQKHWADQSVSVTVYYKRSEIPQLKAWLALNLSKIKTISFLCHNDHGFKQAPKEAISKEDYERLSSGVREVDVDQDEGGDMVDGAECAGGACPVR
jgi:ribonucleotide reductase alpha subunit